MTVVVVVPGGVGPPQVVVAVPGGAGTPTNVTLDGLTNIRKAALLFVIDGGGSVLTTGQKGDLAIPFDCTIQSVELFADRVGSVVVDVYKTTYANFDASTHPAVADKITGAAKPTIVAGTKYIDTALSGWTTTIAAGDIIAFNIDSIAAIQRLTVTLNVSKS